MKKLLFLLIFFPFFANSQSQTNGSIFQYNGDTFGWSPWSTVAGSMNGVTLLASKTSVSGAALASTALDYASGVTLSAYSPSFAIIKFRSGTIGIAVIRIKTDVGYLIAVTALAGMTATDDIYTMQLTGLVRSTGNISIEVTTASLGASAIDCYVYGVKKL